jgi:UDP-hydrolysing UDP-N-acetyl-D-glucosamine 2-epimerase
MNRIAVLTVGRSDFSILHPLVVALLKDDAFEVGLWVGGGHFDPNTGETRQDIIASGLPIWAEIPCTVFSPTPAETNRAMAEQIQGVAGALQASSPDVVVILGDRFEAVSVGLALVPHNIPIAHISGGSITEGAIDDVFRHCLTKMSALHFCDLPEFAQRIEAMGEDPAHIFAVGALGLDGIKMAPRFGFAELAAQFDLPAQFSKGFILATLHPETRRPQDTQNMVNGLLEALEATGAPVIFTYPNADPYSDVIIESINRASQNNPNIHVIKNFGLRWFYTAMDLAICVVGNSSSGIIEAASFGLPVVNIGDRQKGRYCEGNVIHCAIDAPSIGVAVAQATGLDMRAAMVGFQNPYGDGQAIPRVLHALRAIDLLQ